MTESRATPPPKRPATPFLQLGIGQASEHARNFKSNDEIRAAWHKWSETRLAEITLKHYNYQVKKFMDVWGGELVTKVSKADFWNYLANFGRLCRFMTKRARHFGKNAQSRSEIWCRQDMDMSICGKLCASYEPMAVEAVRSHINALVTLYDFLVRCEQVPFNFVRDAGRDWFGENKHRVRRRPQRVLLKNEVELLVSSGPYLNRRTMYLLAAKTGLRVGEAIKLTVDEKDFQLDQGWLRIPDFPGKRTGNRVLVVDDQLRSYLTALITWRERKLDRLGKGTNALFLNHRGDPFPNGEAVNRVLASDAVRVGIQTKGAPAQERVTSHAFRHFFSDAIEKAGVPPNWWDVLRGDTPKGNRATYVHLQPEDIRNWYLKYAPQFEIGPP